MPTGGKAHPDMIRAWIATQPPGPQNRLGNLQARHYFPAMPIDNFVDHSLFDPPCQYLQHKRRRHPGGASHARSEEHTSELQSLMRISYAVLCLKKKNNILHE